MLSLCRGTDEQVVDPQDFTPVVLQDERLAATASELHNAVSLRCSPSCAPRDVATINLTWRSGTSTPLQFVPEGEEGPLPPPAGHQHFGDAPDIPFPAGSSDGSHAAGAAGTAGGPPPAGRSGTSGFVKLQSIARPSGTTLEWTHSRRALEVLLVREQAATRDGQQQHQAGGGDPDFRSHALRLRERLEVLNLDMVDVAGDGNCQFRSVSMELFGTQNHHAHVRRAAVDYIKSQRDLFECFLGEDFDDYCLQMARPCTWGDELTLRAISDSYGVVVRCITSDQGHWYISYEPQQKKVQREIFLSYIAPIHYTTVKRKSSLKTMVLKTVSSIKRSTSIKA